MATLDTIASRVRLELGDKAEPFRIGIRGDGEQKDFDLEQRNPDTTTVTAFRLNSDLSTTSLSSPADFTVDADSGQIHFVVPPAVDDQIIVEGKTYGIFSQDEILQFVTQALQEHLLDRTDTTRYRDSHGFIVYDTVAMDITRLPDAEVPMVAALATIEGLWSLATDASTDINVSTSEGTSIPRGQRFSQIMQLIQSLTEWYRERTLMMGVGLFAPQVFNLRRVSRGTGRLIPLFRDREYDDYGPPQRLTPDISTRDEEIDGPASPWWPGPAGY